MDRSLKVFLVVLVFIFSACDGKFSFNFPGKNTKDANKPVVAAPAPVMEISGPLLAEAGPWRIGLDDFNKKIGALKTMGVPAGVDLDSKEFKTNALNELVRVAVLAQEAQKRGFDKKTDFKEQVAEYKRTLLAQTLVAEATKNIIVTDLEIEDYYQQQKSYFQLPPELKVRELAVNSETVAKDLYIRLLQGEDFSSLAREYSTLGTSSKGGDTGFIIPGDKEKSDKYWTSVITLDQGGISTIFRDDGKYYILKLEEKKEGKIYALNDEVDNGVTLKENIKSVITMNKQTKTIEDLINSAKLNSKITIKEDLIN